MSKKSMVIAGVAALVVVVFAVAVLMMSGKSLSPNTIFAGKGSSATSGNTSVSSSGTATNPSSTANGAPPKTTTGAVNNKPPAGVPVPSPKLPDPGAPAKAPNTPAAEGKALVILTSAPDPTISALGSGSVPDGSQYTIRMQPLGLGPGEAPDSIIGPRLVILVESAKPIGSAPEYGKIVKANVLVRDEGATVTKGGTYTATLTFRSDGTKLIPILSQASVVK